MIFLLFFLFSLFLLFLNSCRCVLYNINFASQTFLEKGETQGVECCLVLDDTLEVTVTISRGGARGWSQVAEHEEDLVFNSKLGKSLEYVVIVLN